MSEMIERVARAIYETDPVGVRGWADAPASNREDCLACARAAIAAMREPTEAMQYAGGTCGGFEFDGDTGTIWPKPIWRAMIDEALK